MLGCRMPPILLSRPVYSDPAIFLRINVKDIYFACPAKATTVAAGICYIMTKQPLAAI
jgi:hypothetical protein